LGVFVTPGAFQPQFHSHPFANGELLEERCVEGSGSARAQFVKHEMLSGRRAFAGGSLSGSSNARYRSRGAIRGSGAMARFYERGD
jgi:hypothetical protein